MRASQILRNVHPQKRKGIVPFEVWPLIIVSGGVLVFAAYRLTTNFRAPGVRRGRQGADTTRLPEVEDDHH